MTFRIDVKTPVDMGVAPVTALAPVPGAGNTQPASDSGTDAVRSHEGASDPHPQYTTDSEATTIANARAAASLSAHVALADPHNQYLPKTGGTITGNLSLTGSLFMSTVWPWNYGVGSGRTIDLDPITNLTSTLDLGFAPIFLGTEFGRNWYFDGTNFRMKVTGNASRISQSGGNVRVYTSGVGVVNAGQTFTFPLRAEFTAAGNFGLGTPIADVRARLEVVSTGTVAILRNSSSTTSSFGELRFASFSGESTGAAWIKNIWVGDNSGRLIFGVCRSDGSLLDRACLNGSGYFGVGTLAPQVRMHAIGGGETTQYVAIFSTVGVDSGYTGVSIGAFGEASGTTGGTALRAFHHHASTTATELGIFTCDSGSTTQVERMRARNNGAVRLIPRATSPGSPLAGDMYYDSALSQFRGWTGASWTVFSGGGSGGGSAPLSADSTPAAPNAMDDEFDVGASIDLTGARRSGATAWAWVNQGAATALQGQGHVVINAPASAGANLRGIEQPISGTAWRVRAKLSAWFGPSGQDFLIGMFVRNSANSRLFSFQKRTDPAPKLSSIRWTTPTSGVTTVQTVDAFSPTPSRNSRVPMYLELELAAGVLTLRYSDTGVNGTFEDFGTELVSSHLLAISHIGLYSYAPPPAGAWGCWDWFRRLA